MTIVPFQPQQQQTTRPSWIEVMERGVELAEIIANTDFVPKGLRGNQAAILAAVMYGHEVGLEPMQSLAKIAVIDGKPSLAAEAQRALILAAGHELVIEESTNTRAVVAGRRRDGRQTTRVTWTLDDAKRARLAGKQNWQAYPRQMLVARASAELARQLFADVIGGMAATEELEDVDAGETAGTTVVEGEPEPPKSRRRRRPSTGTTPPPAAEPPPSPPAAEGPPEPAAPPDAPSELAVRKMFALFKQKGYQERDDRLNYSRRILDRELETSADLSALDVTRLIEALHAEPDPPVDPANPGDPDTEAETMAALDELGARETTREQPPLPGEE